MSHVCLACHLSCVAKTLTWHANRSIKFFRTCHACRHRWLLPFYTTSMTLTLPGCHKVSAKLVDTVDFYHFIPLQWPWPFLGVTRSVQSLTCWLHFLPHFASAQDEIWGGDEQFKLNILRLIWVRTIETRAITAVLHTVSEIQMLACIWAFLIQFDSSLVWWQILLYFTFWYWSNWPWLWFKATGVQESKHFWANYLTKFSVNSNGVCYTV